MAEYVVSNEMLKDKDAQYQVQKARMAGQFTELEHAIQDFIQSDSLQGRAAQQMKNRMSTYSGIIDGFLQSMEAITRGFSAYTGKYRQLDSSENMVIPTARLMELRQELIREKRMLEDSDLSFEAQSNRLIREGYMKEAYHYSSARRAADQFSQVSDLLKEWYEEIHRIEESDINNEFEEIDSMLDSLESELAANR